MRVLLQNLLIFSLLYTWTTHFPIPISSPNLSSESITSVSSVICLSLTLKEHLSLKVDKIAHPSETRGHYCLHAIYQISVIHYALRYL